jgi:hypothetical protein
MKPTTMDDGISTLALITNPPTFPPPPEPPPTDRSDASECPPGCLLDGLTRAPSPTSITINLVGSQSSPSHFPTLPEPPNTFTDSVTRVVCSPRVCGVHSDMHSAITINGEFGSGTKMVDGGSNVCVTGTIGSLVDVEDINPITILVALDGAATSYDDCITKKGLLPITLSDSTSYYQPSFYCANMVETIISPAAVLASSNVFSSWTQVGFKDPTIPGSLHFTNNNGLVAMTFPL